MDSDNERHRPADTSQIVLEDERDVAWWMRELNVDRVQLESAIAEVGPLSVDVQNFLSRQEART